MNRWQELEQKYYMYAAKRLPVTLVRGEGARVWDDENREYLDFVGGWAVNILGHCHPVISQALEEQGRTLIQASNQFYTIPQIKLAQLLVENSCLDKVFLCNSGAEANEGAVKLARKYGKLHLNRAYEIITALNSFHGRTLAMTAATGQAKYQEPYTPLPQGFVNVEYDNIEAIISATNPNTCAVMLEPVQGEGGVHMPSRDYLKNVRAWCDEKGLLFILDEVQTGMGRLGTLFGYQQYDVEPDVITLAKGLGGGVPIGAILAKEKASVFQPGDHGSTFGGNPLACAVAYTVMKFLLEKDILSNVKGVGEFLKKELEELKSSYPIIKEVRGRGLLLAVEFHEEISQDLVNRCLKRGLLLNAVKPNALRFMPPLIITEEDARNAVNILKNTLVEVEEAGVGKR
ncbi:MAG: aspartate aminotransferase family protein [Dehalococcoidia bacterium]